MDEIHTPEEIAGFLLGKLITVAPTIQKINKMLYDDGVNVGDGRLALLYVLADSLALNAILDKEDINKEVELTKELLFVITNWLYAQRTRKQQKNGV